MSILRKGLICKNIFGYPGAVSYPRLISRWKNTHTFGYSWKNTDTFWSNMDNIFKNEINNENTVTLNDIWKKSAFEPRPESKLMNLHSREEARDEIVQYVITRLDQLQEQQEPKKVAHIATYGSSGSGKTRLLHDIYTNPKNYLLKDNNIINNPYGIQFNNTIYLPITYNTIHGCIHEIDGKYPVAGLCWRMILLFIRMKCKYLNDYIGLNEIIKHFDDYDTLDIKDTIELIYNNELINGNIKIPIVILIDEILKINSAEPVRERRYYEVLQAIGGYYDIYNPVYKPLSQNNINIKIPYKMNHNNPETLPFCSFIISSLFGGGLTDFRTASKRPIVHMPLNNIGFNDRLQIIEKVKHKALFESEKFEKLIHYYVALSGGFPSQMNIIYNILKNYSTKHIVSVKDEQDRVITNILNGMNADACHRSDTIIDLITDNEINVLKLLSLKNMKESKNLERYGLTTYNIFVSGMAKVVDGQIVIPPLLLHACQSDTSPNKSILSKMFPMLTMENSIGPKYETMIRNYIYMLINYIIDKELITFREFFRNIDGVLMNKNTKNNIYNTLFIFPKIVKMISDKKKMESIIETNKDIEDGVIYYHDYAKGWDFIFKIYNENKSQQYIVKAQTKTSEATETIGGKDIDDMFIKCGIKSSIDYHINLFIINKEMLKKDELRSNMPNNTFFIDKSLLMRWIHPQFIDIIQAVGYYSHKPQQTIN